MKTTRPINNTGRPDWEYVKSSHTDIAKTFKRIRRELAESKNVIPIKERKHG